jgi:hypothetical protein
MSLSMQLEHFVEQQVHSSLSSDSQYITMALLHLQHRDLALYASSDRMTAYALQFEETSLTLGFDVPEVMDDETLCQDGMSRTLTQSMDHLVESSA